MAKQANRMWIRGGKLALVVSLTAGLVSTIGIASSSASGSATPRGSYGTLPAQSGSPQKGGTISFAESPGATPNYIFPITPAANASVYTEYQFQYLMWRPLYWSPTGVSETIDYPISLAYKPTFSNGNKTITIKMRNNVKWSNGQHVTAKDVLFFLDIVQAAVKASPANWNNYTPGFLPDNIASWSAPSTYTVVLKLKKSYNPGYYFNDQMNLLFALPSQAWDHASATGPALDWTVPKNALAIYNYLNAQSKILSTWSTNPLWQVVDGPFKISSFNAGTGQASLAANESYSFGKAHISTLELLPYTSYTAEVNALRSGKLDVGVVDQPDLPQVGALKSAGYDVFGYPDWGWQYLYFNFTDTTGGWNKLIGQLYIRQVLAHLVDEKGMIQGIFKGAAATDYGPVPSAPSSPYAPKNAITDEYPYSTSTAAKLLKDHGWTVVKGGSSTCTKPGTASNECGAGITKGEKFAFTVYYTNQPTYWGSADTALASSAAQVGIKITVVPKQFNYMVQNFNVPSAPANDNKWQAADFGGFTQDIYPTTNTIFNTGGTFDLGGYSSKQADSLIKASVFGANPTAVKNELSYLDSNIPALFLPNPDQIYAWKNTISGPPSSFSTLTQFYFLPEQWYLKK